ncbi:Bug family tripartite tricarboxylate transporter substrate binding protein [Pseudochelatococcus sp. B33]
MNHIYRRTLFSLMLAVSLGAAVGPAWADYPDRPIRLIVPYAPGGGTDIAARVIAAHLSPMLGQPVVVENKPGGGAQIGTREVADAAPDGYTLLMGSNSMCIDISLYDSLPYDPAKDFIPVAPAGISPNLLLVNAASLPVKSVSELVDYEKAHPGKLNFGSAGLGQTPHLAGELFNLMAGTRITHVPFKGSGESTVNLLSGTVQMSFATMPSTIEYIKSGQLAALAIAAPERTPFLPDVPTMIEMGYPEFIAQTWTGIFVPAGTPPEIVTRLNSSIVTVLESPEVIDLLKKSGLETQPMTPQQFADYFNAEVSRWGKVIREAKISVE